jgi:hypothetical protein
MPQALPNETCAGCLAYLEFSPSLAPESYATHGQGIETSRSFLDGLRKAGLPKKVARSWCAGSPTARREKGRPADMASGGSDAGPLPATQALR